MTRLVTIIDYGMGNLLSVAKAFEACGAEVRVSDRGDHVRDAEQLVLPGVGAFGDAMARLRDIGLDEAIRDFCRRERPFLGICLGMQMMLGWSKEFGLHEGLNLIEGTVEPVEATDIDGNPHKIPHIGWTGIEPRQGREKWSQTILQNTEPGSSFYFVHSFTAVPVSPENRLADAYYDSRLISAVIGQGTLFGCQFHPEKSGREGLKLIKSFLDL
jgi:glutamine amidotransferase